MCVHLFCLALPPPGVSRLLVSRVFSLCFSCASLSCVISTEHSRVPVTCSVPALCPVPWFPVRRPRLDWTTTTTTPLPNTGLYLRRQPVYRPPACPQQLSALNKSYCSWKLPPVSESASGSTSVREPWHWEALQLAAKRLEAQCVPEVNQKSSVIFSRVNGKLSPKRAIFPQLTGRGTTLQNIAYRLNA